jgi:hypothetical protein
MHAFNDEYIAVCWSRHVAGQGTQHHAQGQIAHLPFRSGLGSRVKEMKSWSHTGIKALYFDLVKVHLVR